MILQTVLVPVKYKHELPFCLFLSLLFLTQNMLWHKLQGLIAFPNVFIWHYTVLWFHSCSFSYSVIVAMICSLPVLNIDESFLLAHLTTSKTLITWGYWLFVEDQVPNSWTLFQFSSGTQIVQTMPIVQLKCGCVCWFLKI